MADPLGTVGAPKQSESELDLIYRGGATFAERLSAMAAVRDANEAAYAKLKIGNDIQAAKDNAASLEADAKSKQEQAITALDEARKQAAKLIEDAGAQAAKTKDAALADAKAVAAGGAKLKSEADDYAAARKEVADVLLKDAQDKHDQAKAVQAEATKAKTTHENAAAAFASKQQVAEQTQAKLDAKIARLQEVLREVMEG